MLTAKQNARGLALVRRLLKLIGEDPERPGLIETPYRVLKSWREIFGGYAEDPKEILSKDFEKDGYDQMIVCRDIEFYSTCEHHMQPFFGRAHVAYIPGDRVVGLSKLARVVDCFARRLQIQERLTEQVATALVDHLKPKGVGVMIEAKHFCMVCRGVRKQNSSMITTSLKGCFRDAGARSEFLAMISAAQ
jgi:GTP cyclohydrolase I